MTIALVTGAAGLVGAAAVKHFAERGMDVVGIDNDMRKSFFGEAASQVCRPGGRRSATTAQTANQTGVSVTSTTELAIDV